MQRMSQPGAVFLVLALPFYLNDIAFITFDGTYGVYLTDYLTRLLVLLIALAWSPARAVVQAEPDGRPYLVVALAVVVLLPFVGRAVNYLVATSLARLPGTGGLFAFGEILDPMLYWLDPTAGLLLVALSEEIVFRKVAALWLERRGLGRVPVVLISALLFSAMHWGSGVRILCYTFVAGLLYMSAYLYLRRLWPLVAAHWLEDFLAFGPFDL